MKGNLEAVCQYAGILKRQVAALQTIRLLVLVENDALEQSSFQSSLRGPESDHNLMRESPNLPDGARLGIVCRRLGKTEEKCARWISCGMGMFSYPIVESLIAMEWSFQIPW